MKICVIGSGTMGSGIVQAFAQAGVAVVLKSRSDVSAKKAVAKISKSINRRVEKGKITKEQMDKTLANISTTTNYDTFKDADLVIEAAIENMELKKEIFTILDKVCKPETILASNTSSLSITEIASLTSRPEKVIGMHFFNPAPAMKLVELIKGQKTSEDTFQKVFDLALSIGKEPIKVNEAPGFVVNRILIPLVNEGIGILADGVATKEEIDNAMKLGANHPMGPLALGDLIGLDVCLAIMEVLHKEFGDDKYRAHPLLRKMVRANLLGRKTKEGFYKY